MTISKEQRGENQRLVFHLMLKELAEHSIDTVFFDPSEPPFKDEILRTCWEELHRNGYIEPIGTRYRLTSKGWLTGLELSAIAGSEALHAKLGHILAAMKVHVKGRQDSAVVPFHELVSQCGETEGLVFNVIESKATSTGNNRTGAAWFNGERGRLVEIPVDFNMEPLDIASALTVDHLRRIEELEEQLEIANEDRAQYHCPHCDAALDGIAQEDIPEGHCIVTHETYACGYATADGFEQSPCPYGPHYPAVDEFDFETKQDGHLWFCYARPKTRRAEKVGFQRQGGASAAEAEETLKARLAPKKR